MSQANIWIAFWAGLASFISPCCLPLYPSYLSYITGVSVGELKASGTNAAVRFRTMSHSLAFIGGFSIVFIFLGMGAGLIGNLLFDYRDLISQLAALLIFLMGLFMLGIFQPQWLMRERKLQFKWKPAGYLGSVMIGMGFAAGWSPCVGPILGSILSIAATEPGKWLPLMVAYSLGFAIPFFVLAFFIGSTRWILRYSQALMKVSGALMIVIAVLLFTGKMTQITIWLNKITPSWLMF